MHKIAIGLAAAAIVSGGSTLTASAIDHKTGEQYRRHHGPIVDHKPGHPGPRGQAPRHHGPIVDYKPGHPGPRGQAPRHHGPIVDYKPKHPGPRGQAPHHHGPIVDVWPRHHGPRGQGPWHKGPERFGPRGQHTGPIPHYRGGRITDTWP
jgi:hypothetical protein